MLVHYKSDTKFVNNYTDGVFFKNAIKLLKEGYSTKGQAIRAKWEDGTPAYTKKLFGIINKYDLSKEFPILTLREINWKAALDEILWIWQRKSNNVHDLNSHIWDTWADETGSIGKAYGYQLNIKHQYPEGEFDQVDKLLYDLKNNPYCRRMIVNMYNHADLHEMNLYPCAYSVTFDVTDGRLNAILNQRSNDFLVANNWNVIQYSLLVHMLAQVNNLKPGMLIHVVADMHLYDRHEEIISHLINKLSSPSPTLVINPEIKNFYDFTVDDFTLENYTFGCKLTKIPVAE